MKITLLLGIVFISAYARGQNVHPDVQAALAWQIPDLQCKFKFKSSGVTSDLDRKYKRAVKIYGKCIANYQDELTAAGEELMAVAQHGLTLEQADIVMGHMMNIKKRNQLIETETQMFQENASREDVPMDAGEFIFRGHQ